MDELKKFVYFHDWYIDIIATRNEADPEVPDTFILGLFDKGRRATITFRGVTRVSFENGGLLNIVYAIELLEPDSEPYKRATALLERSAHGKQRAANVAYVFATAGAEIAVEFDSIRIEAA